MPDYNTKYDEKMTDKKIAKIKSILDRRWEQNSGLMTSLEMEERLSNGEDPLDLSIEKWQRVVDKYDKYPDFIIEDSFLGAETCALCEKHQNPFTISNDCSNCPLYLKFNIRCGDEDSPYIDFYHNRCRETALAMLNALYECQK